ncbi:MAG: hypothetical protein GY725_05165 [bacterium]|nr:hypothetical protein [bacterium]
MLRAENVFIDALGRTVLVEALVIEAGRKQSFYVKMAGHERGSVTVRIDPMTHPERSPGVRELVAHIAAAVIRVSPDARLGTANIVLPSLGEIGDET